MPPTKHKTGTKSPLLQWIMKRSRCDYDTALNAFESAKQARYLIHKDGAWHYDADAGFDHWNKKKVPASATANPAYQDTPSDYAPLEINLTPTPEEIAAAHATQRAEMLALMPKL